MNVNCDEKWFTNKAERLKSEGDLKGAADLYQIMYNHDLMLPKIRTKAIKMNKETLELLRAALPADKPDPAVVRIDLFSGLKITVDESIPTGQVEFDKEVQGPASQKSDS
jgi:hypothetical protein